MKHSRHRTACQCDARIDKRRVGQFGSPIVPGIIFPGAQLAGIRYSNALYITAFCPSSTPLYPQFLIFFLLIFIVFVDVNVCVHSTVLTYMFYSKIIITAPVIGPCQTSLLLYFITSVANRRRCLRLAVGWFYIIHTRTTTSKM